VILGRARYLGRQFRRRLADPASLPPWRQRPPTDAPDLGLVGYFGWGNYGDELFAEVYREHLGPPMRQHLVLQMDSEGRTSHKVAVAAKASDAILIGGGDIVVPWVASNRYFDRVYLRRPVFVTGVAVPTWQAPVPAGIIALRRFYQHPNLRYINVRDAVSADWIRTNLDPSVEVRLSPDIVCALTLPEVVRRTDPPIFGVAVRQRAQPDDLTQVKAMCNRAIELGYRLRRIVLSTGLTRARDLEATKQLGFEDTELISSDNLDDISRGIGECTAFASMKFHGVVVATMYGVPAFVMMPTHKNKAFLAQIDRPDLLTVYSSPDLVDHVSRDVTPISADVRASLRNAASASLAELRTEILAATARRG
jgi:polysaccharide pyruvyl transferase WcaK-like protein